MEKLYDHRQFRQDCRKILDHFGVRKPYGFFTIQEYEFGRLLITTRDGFKVLFNGQEVLTVRMGSEFANHILQTVLMIEEDQKWRKSLKRI